MKTLKNKLFVFGAVPIVLCTGCAGSQALKIASDSAIAANIKAQSIAPSAAQKADTHIPADVTVQEAARERYRTGKVTPPRSESTY